MLKIYIEREHTPQIQFSTNTGYWSKLKLIALEEEK